MRIRKINFNYFDCSHFFCFNFLREKCCLGQEYEAYQSPYSQLFNMWLQPNNWFWGCVDTKLQLEEKGSDLSLK